MPKKTTNQKFRPAKMDGGMRIGIPKTRDFDDDFAPVRSSRPVKSVPMPPVSDLPAFTAWICERNALHMGETDAQLSAAYDEGDPKGVATWLTLYAHMRRNLGGDIATWFALKKQTREVVTLDEVLEIFDVEGEEWRRGFASLGAKLASKMTGDPERDRATIDEAVDAVFARFDLARDKAANLFDNPAPSDEADATPDETTTPEADF